MRASPPTAGPSARAAARAGPRHAARRRRAAGRRPAAGPRPAARCAAAAAASPSGWWCGTARRPRGARGVRRGSWAPAPRARRSPRRGHAGSRTRTGSRGGRRGLAERAGREGRDVTAELLEHQPPAAHVGQLALLPLDQHRRRDEDRRVGAREHAHEQREGEVLQRLAAEQQQRADRHQDHEARGQRPGEDLGHRPVRDLREGRPRHARHVLAYSVEHDHRVVQRVTHDRQQGGDRGGRDLPVEEGVHARGDQKVVREGDHHRHGELPLESEPDVDRDQEQGRNHRDHGGARDLGAEGRADRVRDEVLGRDAVVVVERVLHLRRPAPARAG